MPSLDINYHQPGYDPGLIPDWVYRYIGSTAPEQYSKASLTAWFNRVYAHGGGWHPQPGFTMGEDGGLLYPGDPLFPVRLFIEIDGKLQVFMYDHAYVAVREIESGDFEVCRMD